MQMQNDILILKTINDEHHSGFEDKQCSICILFRYFLGEISLKFLLLLDRPKSILFCMRAMDNYTNDRNTLLYVFKLDLSFKICLAGLMFMFTCGLLDCTTNNVGCIMSFAKASSDD